MVRWEPEEKKYTSDIINLGHDISRGVVDLIPVTKPSDIFMFRAPGELTSFPTVRPTYLPAPYLAYAARKV